MHVLLVVTLLGASPEIDEARLAKLFGFTGTGAQRATQAVAPQPLDCRVLGTMLGTIFSLASLECGSKVMTVGEGDHLQDTIVIGIERERVFVMRGETRLSIERAMRPKTEAPVVAPKTVSPAQLAAAVQHPEALMQQTRLMPALDGTGKLIGFRATWVKEGSLVASFGLQRGDVLKKVNGVALDDLGRAMQMLPKLMTAQRFDVEIDRGGSIVTETARLTP